MRTPYAIVATTLFIAISSAAEWTDDRRRVEAEQVTLWEQKLSEARAAAPEARPALLWLGLKNMAHRSALPGRSPEVLVIYRRIQDELLAIPGHAKYFADEIKREQKEVAKDAPHPGDRISYNRNRSNYFRTLTHLPSPETIAVLGEFLSDDIDTPRLKISPDSDWGENPRANSFSATYALSLIGLRDPPASKEFYDAEPDAHLAKSRAWWEEVKAGRKTVSFLGQKVEHRFKPDGTWETIAMQNPPDDGKGPSIQVVNPEASSSPHQRSERPEPARGINQWWLAGMGTFLVAALGLWLRSRGRRPA